MISKIWKKEIDAKMIPSVVNVKNKYEIFTSHCVEALSETVTEKMNKGWLLYGDLGTHYNSGRYYQAMIKSDVEVYE